MKIYLDYVFIINFLFDLILLLGISIINRIKISKHRLILSTFIGSISGFLVLLKISSTIFFILKLLSGVLMITICFSYKNFKYTLNNFIYLITLSILLGGSLYLFNIEASKTVLGRNFSSNNISYLIILFITGLITIIFYSKYAYKTKKVVINKYKTSFTINNKTINLTGYLDTGNNLIYKKRPVIILNKNIKLKFDKKIEYIPFATVNGTGVMKAYLMNEIFIEQKKYKNIYIGISNDKFQLKGSDIILNINLWEDRYEKVNKKNNK